MLGKSATYFTCILFLTIAQDKRLRIAESKIESFLGLIALWKIPDTEIKLRAQQKVLSTFLQDVCKITDIFNKVFYKALSMSLAL